MQLAGVGTAARDGAGAVWGACAGQAGFCTAVQVGHAGGMPSSGARIWRLASVQRTLSRIPDFPLSHFYCSLSSPPRA